MKEYNPLYDSACLAIGRNGFEILKMPKYSSQIKKTLVKTLKSGLVVVTWVDARGRCVAENLAGAREWYPMIGEVEEVTD